MVIGTVALERYLNVAYNKAYDQLIQGQGIKDLMGLVLETESTGKNEPYGWLGDVPVVQEWIGTKEYAGLKSYDYTIENKKWFTGIEVDEDELEDDQFKMILPRVQMMAKTMFDHKMELIANFILNGDTYLAYDGSAYFANRTVNDNLLAGTGTTLAQLKADLGTGRTAMMRFVSDTGKLFRFSPNVIVCPPELEVSFKEIVQSTSPQDAATYNAGGKNVWSSWITSVVSLPELTDTDDWYLFCSNYPLKPFIYQNRRSPRNRLDDTQVKNSGKLYYSSDKRGNAGYGLPVMGIKIVN
jgi:phage major head subunit gpT-like protein